MYKTYVLYHNVVGNLQTEMRVTTFLILIFIYIKSSGQVLTGKYQDSQGQTLKLNKDSTFRYDFNFDLVKIWSTGKWTLSHDTLYLDFITIYDTLTRTNKADSLVKSIDEKSNRINEVEFTTSLLVSGGQDRQGITGKFFRKRKRLYPIDIDGRLLKFVVYDIGEITKYPLWYSKTD